MNAHQRRIRRRAVARVFRTGIMTSEQCEAVIHDARIERHYDRGGKCGCAACRERGWTSRKGRHLFDIADAIDADCKAGGGR